VCAGFVFSCHFLSIYCGPNRPKTLDRWIKGGNVIDCIIMVPEEGGARKSLGGFAIGLCGAAPGW
jgi:hypothetical protein